MFFHIANIKYAYKSHIANIDQEIVHYPYGFVTIKGQGKATPFSLSTMRSHVCPFFCNVLAAITAFGRTSCDIVCTSVFSYA